jgi:glutamate synthase (NADPH/NADH) small chain
MFSVSTQKFVSEDGLTVSGLELVEVEFTNGSLVPINGSEQVLAADIVLLALGFTGAERAAYIEQLGVEVDDRGNIARKPDFTTDIEGVFVAGDAGRGQSLIVWAIAEGRAAAASVDSYLMGSTNLPSPVLATDRPLTI